MLLVLLACAGEPTTPDHPAPAVPGAAAVAPVGLAGLGLPAAPAEAPTLPTVEALQGAPGSVRLAGPEVALAVAATVNPVTQALGLSLETVTTVGSGESLASLTDGRADAALIGRPLRPSESAFTATLIGWDGVVLVVAEVNPVPGLTTDAVRRLYAGEVQDWAEVGGAPGPVHLVQRPSGKNASRLFEEHFGLTDAVSPSAATHDTEAEVAGAVRADPGALGYLSLASLRGGGTAGLRVLPLDGVAPDAAALTSQRYPLARPVSVLSLIHI